MFLLSQRDSRQKDICAPNPLTSGYTILAKHNETFSAGFYVHREYAISRAPLPVRFEWERCRNNCHSAKERSADVDRNGSGGIGVSRDEGRDNAHNSIARNSNTVAGCTMSGRQDLRCVRIQTAIVNIGEEGNGATEAEILRFVANLSVGKEESHRAQSSDHHCVFSSQDLRVAHPASQHRSLEILLLKIFRH